MSGPRGLPGAWAGRWTSSLSSESPLPVLLRDAGSGARQTAPPKTPPTVSSLLGSATGRYWREIGRWEGEQGLPSSFRLLPASLKPQRRAWLQPPASFGPLRTSRRTTSPPKPKLQPAAPPAVVKAPAKPRSPPRSERQPRPRPEVRPPPAKQRPPQKAKPPPRSSPQRGPGTGRGGSPGKAPRFW